MTHRKMITADHVNGLHVQQNVNVLTALVTDGPASTPGRGVQVFMTDDTIRGILAYLALDARWAAALLTLGTSPRVLAATAGLRHFPSTVGERADLAALMKRAMDNQDAELAVDKAQGTQTRLGTMAVLARQQAHRLNLPATAPEGEDEMHAALTALGGAIVHAGSGCVTELVLPDGSVAARIVPA